MIKGIEISSIERDMALQPRATTNRQWIEEYAEDILNGAQMPPVVVFFDGEKNWLADGFHRLYATEAAGLTNIEADVREGTRRDALRYTCSANATHGQRRDPSDIKKNYNTAIENDFFDNPNDTHEVAKFLKCTLRWAQKLTREVRHKTDAERDEKIARLKEEGKSVREIEEETGISKSTVQRASVPKANGSFMGHKADDRDSESDDSPEPTTAAGAAAPPKPKVPDRFDWDAARLRSQAMDSIQALADLPAPQKVIEAWMKTMGYGKPIETLDAAVEWLLEFRELYRDAEPKRVAKVERAAEIQRAAG